MYMKRKDIPSIRGLMINDFSSYDKFFSGVFHFRKENLKPGSWNEISFAQDNIKSDRTFYLVALQNHNAPDTLTVGIDSNKEIGTDGSKASYMFNGAFTPGSEDHYRVVRAAALFVIPPLRVGI